MVCSTYAEYSLVWRINGLNVFDTSLLNDFIFTPQKFIKSAQKCILTCRTRFHFLFLFYQLTCDMCLWIDDCIFAKTKHFSRTYWQMSKNHWNLCHPLIWFSTFFYVNRHSMLSTSSWHVHSSSQMIYFRYQYFTN